jgi:hypothetical protein
MQLFLDSQSRLHDETTAVDARGDVLRCNGKYQGTYYSLFGAIRFTRRYYCGQGEGFFALDAALNLPPKGPSDFLRKLTEDLAIDMSYIDTSVRLAKYFPIATSTRALQQAILTDSEDAPAFYAQAPVPPSCVEASILVAQADGKGVPMVKNTSAPDTAIAGQAKDGPKREGKTKEATVVSVSTHVPFLRTPEQVRDSLFRKRDDDSPACGDPREKPALKRIWASIQGKEAALDQAKIWSEQFDNKWIRYRVTLTDGSEALKNRVDETFPDHERVLDVIHATQYLWKAADAKFGKSSQPGWSWVYDSVLLMLQGKTCEIIDALDGWLAGINDSEVARWKAIEKSANYLEKNQNAMKYDEYLSKGWPIATGIIEGACRHVVKDRCERSGMRWTEHGVEAFLRLRCVHQNGDWDAYHNFRMQQRHQNVYGVKSNMNQGTLETNVCNFNTHEEYAQAA